MADPMPGQVAVLIPAAGKGTRLGGVSKQFRNLGGAPLLWRTLRAFERHDAIDHLVVAAPSGIVSALEEELLCNGFSKLLAVVRGGATRANSVRRALESVTSGVEIVLVHDAVRPFVEARLITEIINAARSRGAAALGLAAVDTMRHAARAMYTTTLERRGLYRMQTPQGFKRVLLEAAYKASGEEATDDAELVQRLGHSVAVVAGSPCNFKITTREDWALAQLLWPRWEAAQGSEARQ